MSQHTNGREHPVAMQRFAAYGIAERRNHVLLVRLGSAAGCDHGKWLLPGGKIEHGEHPSSAVIREFREETGYEIAVGPLLGLDSDRRTINGLDLHAIFAIYHVRICGGALSATGHGGAEKAEWVSWEDLPSLPLLTAIRRHLERHRSNRTAGASTSISSNASIR